MEHSFDIEHASLYGIEEAIFIRHFQFWLLKNQANQKNQFDNRTWTYNSVKSYAKLFPYMTEARIRRTIESLLNQKVIVKGNYNKSGYDRTAWFAFNDESIFLFQQLHLSKLPNGFGKKSEPIPDTTTIINSDKTTDNIKPNGSLFEEQNIVDNSLEKKEKSSAKKIVDPAFNVLKETFVDWYKKEIELEYMFAGAKDGTAIKQLCSKFRQVLKEKHREEITVEIIKDAFLFMLNNLPKWDKENVTLSLLNSRFNVILSQLKSKNKKHASGITAEQAWYISL